MNRQATQSTSSARRKVLLVDDDEHVRRTLALLLTVSTEWHVVGSAADATTALALATTLLPDLVLLDLWLATGDSLDLIPQLRALEPEPLVVILTADPGEAMQRQALALGARKYLDKMTSPLDLLAELRSLFPTAHG